MISLFQQPWHGPFYKQLSADINQTQSGDRVIIVTAFTRSGGVRLLSPALQGHLERGGSIEVVTGVDCLGTSRQALEALMALTPSSFVFHDAESFRTFHDKFYFISRQHAGDVLYIASNNLTMGGLKNNYELSTRYALTPGKEEAVRHQFFDIYRTIRHHTRAIDTHLMEKLCQAGLLADENGGGIAHASSPTPEHRRRLLQSRFTTFPVGITSRRTDTVVGKYLMTLQKADLKRGNSSPDIWIPVTARNAYPHFWQWPYRYARQERGSGIYDSEEFRMQIALPGQPPVVEAVRLYHYHNRDEFRMNTGRIRAVANVDDLLVVERMKDADYEYRLSVVPQSSTLYSSMLSCCEPLARAGSRRQFGYLKGC